MRIGNSIDFHPFKEGRLFILGGVTIPCDKGLEGVSDADPLLHSIAEAILGALALGDLGTHFKEEDSKDLDSKLILLKVKNMMTKMSYKVVNVDSIILLEILKHLPISKSSGMDNVAPFFTLPIDSWISSTAKVGDIERSNKIWSASAV